MTLKSLSKSQATPKCEIDDISVSFKPSRRVAIYLRVSMRFSKVTLCEDVKFIPVIFLFLLVRVLKYFGGTNISLDKEMAHNEESTFLNYIIVIYFSIPINTSKDISETQ